ncbi:MAG: hypothetical protein H3C43_10460 [Leptonema sp. (in: Bacteria)]|nr:hypothetical protein [Leptonema sp. (in: bacteria)]
MKTHSIVKTKIQLEIDGWLEFTQVETDHVTCDLTTDLETEIGSKAELNIENGDWPASMKSLKRQLEQVKPLIGD